VYAGHPWVFQQAVAHVEGGAVAGDEVTVVDPHNNVLGRGLYSPKSAIPVRLFRQEDLPIDGAFFRERLSAAAALRADLGLPSPETSAYRLVHGEGDGLPGLIVDVLGDTVVVQLNTIGIKLREGLVFDAIDQIIAPKTIVDRTSPSAARMEGVAVGAGVVRGSAIDALSFVERGFVFEIPLSVGQKTGYYLDQRTMRGRVEAYARGRRVLDTYAFVGSFALAAARGGATRVVAVDENATIAELAAEIVRKNALSGVIEVRRQDAVKAMDDASSEGGFDLVICDPPKLSPSRGAKSGALGAYQRIARAACRATRPGGLLVFCSCSAAVSTEELVRVLALGARDVRMTATVLERNTQGPDHPVPAAFPEGLYLKSVIARMGALS
jgi:23S rRNA (cytosine1962-C5)-methyltransferase